MTHLLDGQLAVRQRSEFPSGGQRANDGNSGPREHAWSTEVTVVQQSSWHSAPMFRHFSFKRVRYFFPHR
jgi:hypothetical protein